jgi:hypothetical protein
MIYVGDGLTDVPCMKLVKVNGGCSIAVYQKRKKKKVEDLLRHDRVDYLELADYSEGGELERCVQEVIQQMAQKDKLVRRSKAQLSRLF